MSETKTQEKTTLFKMPEPITADKAQLKEFVIDFEHTKDNVNQEDLQRIASFFSRNSLAKEKFQAMINAYKTEKGINPKKQFTKDLVKKYGMNPVAVKSVSQTILNYTRANNLGPNSKQRFIFTPGTHLGVLNIIIKGLNRFYNDYKQHIPTGIEDQPDDEEEATDVLPTGDTPAEAEEKEHARGEGLTEGQDPSP